MIIKVKRLSRDIQLPEKKSELAAGFDLQSTITTFMSPGSRKLIPCGFAMEIPVGYEGQIRPRSGLAYRKGLTVLNSPGTIDSDYRGEVKVLLINDGVSSQNVSSGDRIAQLVICPVPDVELEEVDELSDTPRGNNGFGSTGDR